MRGLCNSFSKLAVTGFVGALLGGSIVLAAAGVPAHAATVTAPPLVAKNPVTPLPKAVTNTALRQISYTCPGSVPNYYDQGGGQILIYGVAPLIPPAVVNVIPNGTSPAVIEIFCRYGTDQAPPPAVGAQIDFSFPVGTKNCQLGADGKTTTCTSG